MYEDIAAFVRFVRKNSPSGRPIILAGNVYSAGMLINYDNWKEKDPVDGFVFIAPQLGFKARETWRRETMEELIKTRTVKAHFKNIILAHITGGFLMGRQPVYSFQVSDEDYSSDPMISDKFSVISSFPYDCIYLTIL